MIKTCRNKIIRQFPSPVTPEQCGAGARPRSQRGLVRVEPVPPAVWRRFVNQRFGIAMESVPVSDTGRDASVTTRTVSKSTHASSIFVIATEFREGGVKRHASDRHRYLPDRLLHARRQDRPWRPALKQRSIFP